MFTFANQAGLDMLETTLVALQDITLEKILDDGGRKVLCAEFPKIMEQVRFKTMLIAIINDKGFSHHTFSSQRGTWLDSLSGLCISARWYMCVEHGAASILRAGRGLEGPERRGCAPLFSFHVC